MIERRIATRLRTTRQLHVLTMAGKRPSRYRIKFQATLLVQPQYTALIFTTHASLGSKLSRMVGARTSGPSIRAELRRIFRDGHFGSGIQRTCMSYIRTITSTRHGIRILATDTFGRAHLFHFAVTRSRGG